MRIIYVKKKRPRDKIKLDPLEADDLNIDLEIVAQWS